MMAASFGNFGLNVRDRIAERWPKLDQRQLDHIGRHAGRLIEAVQAKYGLSKEAATREVQIFLNRTCQDLRQHQSSRKESK